MITWEGKGCVLQLKNVSLESIDPNLSRDLYWSSEATEDEARNAMAAAMLGCDVRPPFLPPFLLSMWTNSRPEAAPTSWTCATLSRASEL